MFVKFYSNYKIFYNLNITFKMSIYKLIIKKYTSIVIHTSSMWHAITFICTPLISQRYYFKSNCP